MGTGSGRPTQPATDTHDLVERFGWRCRRRPQSRGLCVRATSSTSVATREEVVEGQPKGLFRHDRLAVGAGSLSGRSSASWSVVHPFKYPVTEKGPDDREADSFVMLDCRERNPTSVSS